MSLTSENDDYIAARAYKKKKGREMHLEGQCQPEKFYNGKKEEEDDDDATTRLLFNAS